MKPIFFALSLLPVFSAAVAAEPRPIKFATVQFVTGDDGKDDTDVLTVVVADAKGKILERVFDAKQEIKPGTTFNLDRKSTRLNSSHVSESRMPSSA